MTTETEALIAARNTVHGDWIEQSSLAQRLKAEVGACAGDLKPYQLEAIEMILVKISRICCGDPSHADHWDDIAGYALLGKGGHK